MAFCLIRPIQIKKCFLQTLLPKHVFLLKKDTKTILSNTQDAQCCDYGG